MKNTLEQDQSGNYRWYILALSAITSALVIGIPFSCMPVLFKEISDDLGLSLVQIGTVWGIGSLAGFFVSLPGGFLGDRFGGKRMTVILCIGVGITGALRGLSDSFFALTATVFLNGLMRAVLPLIIIKMIGVWFQGKKLAMANGMSAMGMGLGLMLGPLISATYLSPLLGGWRHIMYLYGAVCVVIGIVWWLTAREPAQTGRVSEKRPAVPVFQTIARLAHIPTLWLLGVTIMFRSGTIMGTAGYLPLYLRDQGWTAASADATQTIFYAASTLFVVPFTLLSDKLGSRKAVLLPMIVVTMVCIALLPFASSFTVLVLMFLAGMSMDGFMATASAMVLETKGVGPAFSGTALGITFTIAQLGGLVAPPLGNSLAVNNPALPFLVWASFSIVALCTIIFVKETGWRQKQKAEAAD